MRTISVRRSLAGLRRRLSFGGRRHAPRPRRVVAGRSPTLRAAIDSMADAPEFSNAHWGILIVDPERGDTLYSRNAGKLFMPASNMKILTSATALAQLGPDYRFKTTFAARGSVADGTLDGDLVVIGRGDPSVSDHMLQRRDDSAARDRRLDRRARHQAHHAAASSPAATRFPARSSATVGRTTTSRTRTRRRSTSCCSTRDSASCTCAAAIAPGDPVRVETRPARSFPRVHVAARTVGPRRRRRARGARRTRCARERTARPGTSSSRATIAARDSAVIEVTRSRSGDVVPRRGARSAARQGHRRSTTARPTRPRGSRRSRRCRRRR